MTDQLTICKRGPSPRFRKPARTKMFSIVFMLHYIEISAEQPSTSFVGHQTALSSSPERRPSTSRGEPQPSTSGQCQPSSDYVLHELRPLDLDSDDDLKGVLVGYYIIPFKNHLVNLFISICFIHEYYSNANLPQSVCVEIQIFKRYSLYGHFYLALQFIIFTFQPAVNNFFLHY